MLICTQDKHRVVKFKDITDLYISYLDNDNTIYCTTPEHEYDDYLREYDIPLGTYETKDGCKKVIIEILNRYQRIQEYKHNKSNFTFAPSFVYFMPEE